MNEDDNDDNREETEQKSKLPKPRNISSVFGKCDSRPKVEWDVKKKLNKQCSFKASNSVKNGNPDLKNMKIKWQVKDSPHKASFTFKPFETNNGEGSFKTSYHNTQFTTNFKEKGDIGVKITHKMDLLPKYVKLQLDMMSDYRNYELFNKGSAKLSVFSDVLPHKIQNDRLLEIETNGKINVKTQKEFQMELQCLLNLSKNPTNKVEEESVENLPAIQNEKIEENGGDDNDEGDEKQKESKYKKKNENVEYKFMVTDKLIYKRDPEVTTSFLLENTKSSKYYKVDGTISLGGNTNLTVMGLWKWNRSVYFGLMGKTKLENNRLSQKMEAVAQLFKVKHLGDFHLSFSTLNLGMRFKKRWGRNLTTEFMFQKPWNSNIWNYGLKMSIHA